MTKSIMFKYPLGVEAQCKVTSFRGAITVRVEQINGVISYGLQPRGREGEDNWIPDCKSIDEASITGAEVKQEKVTFKFDTGDRVKNPINGYEGVVVTREQWLNGCIRYDVETTMAPSAEKGLVRVIKQFWEQELELASQPKVKTAAKKRTGGPTYTITQ